MNSAVTAIHQPSAVSAAGPFVSVVIPVYNEHASIERVVSEVSASMSGEFDWELIIVDDGSNDGSWAEIEKCASGSSARIRAIRLRRRFGQSAALQAGIDAALGTVLVTLDGDGQNPPCEIPGLVHQLLDGDLDLVSGWRRQRQDGRWSRILPSRIANRLIAWSSGVRLHDLGCSLKAYRTDVLRHVHLQGEMHRFIPVWLIRYTDPSRIAEREVSHRARTEGISKYGLSRTVRVLLDLLSVLFFVRYATRPGHFFGSIGLVCGGIGTLMLGYLLALKLAGEDIGQRPMLLAGLLLVITGVQFVTAGVIGEFIARLFHGESGPERRVYSVAEER